MMQRLQRIDAQSRSSSSSRHNPVHVRRGSCAQHHRLSREELFRRWHLLLVKMRAMMVYFENRRRLIFILGLDAATLESSDAQSTYVLRNMMRGSVEEQTEQTDVAPAQRPNHARIIGQEVMGKFLGKSEFQKGTPIDTVEDCPHPTTELKRRAAQAGRRAITRARKSYWFTCMRCHGRWERSVLQQNRNEVLADSDTIDFQCAHFGAT